MSLTLGLGGLTWSYHLRSNSGSNGPEAKESHRFLASGPFKFFQKNRPSLYHVGLELPQQRFRRLRLQFHYSIFVMAREDTRLRFQCGQNLALVLRNFEANAAKG